MIGGAIFDTTQTYRYRLWRQWSDAPSIGFVMLNPNCADATINDPTIRRCIGFAKAWGFGRLEVVNLFAYRARTPSMLKHVNDPIGAENDLYLSTLNQRVEKVVLAWGNWGRLGGRDRALLSLLTPQSDLYTLGLTKLGQPKHPLYLRQDSSLSVFSTSLDIQAPLPSRRGYLQKS